MIWIGETMFKIEITEEKSGHPFHPFIMTFVDLRLETPACFRTS